jgi:hypothetical protein
LFHGAGAFQNVSGVSSSSPGQYAKVMQMQLEDLNVKISAVDDEGAKISTDQIIKGWQR